MLPSAIRAAIEAAIYENTTGAITGTALRQVLLDLLAIDTPVATSIPSGGLLPGVVYELGELSGSVTLTLAAGTTGAAAHYYLTFDTGATAPTITWPAVSWLGDAPEIGANMHYEVSILDGEAIAISREAGAVVA